MAHGHEQLLGTDSGEKRYIQIVAVVVKWLEPC